MRERNGYINVINYPYIDYIIKSYVSELQFDEIKMRRVNMYIFREAMMHHSTKYEDHHKTYDRLEYLGDAIFQLVTTEYLYTRYDEENEGFLTKLRIRIERGDSMVHLSKILGLDQFVQVYNIEVNDHILEDIFEAFIGAFYLSFGFKYSKILIVNLVEKHKNLSELILHDDNYKDLLLRYYHQMKWGHPIYENVRTSGKNTGSKSVKKNYKFMSTVKNPDGKKIGHGISNSRAKAEQLASHTACIKLGIIVNGEIDLNWIDKIDRLKVDDADKKNKTDKKVTPVFNPNNKLISIIDVKKILINYNIAWHKDYKIRTSALNEAMTHKSYVMRKKMTANDKVKAGKCVRLQKKSNERLRFVGVSVIHFVIGEFLYHKYPNMDEGFLTRLRSKLENRESLFFLARKTGIDSFLLISQNIELLHARNNINIIGGGFEAFIGVLYIELGLAIAKQFILEIVRVELDLNVIAESETNYKDLILQLYNANYWGRPVYKTIKEEGPDHRKTFVRGIYLNNKLMGKGYASSKRKAEQIASKQMYEKIIKQ